MNMFKPTSAKTPKEYLEQIQDPERKKDMVELDKLIRATVPELPPHIQSGMIGYGKYPYKTKAGVTGEWMVIGLASQKNYISLYVCASDGKEYVAETYKEKLPKASIGKSCVRFKRLADVDQPVLVDLVEKGAKMMAVHNPWA